MAGIDYTLGMQTAGFNSGVSGALGKLGALGAKVAAITAGAGLAAGVGITAIIAKSIGKSAELETLETAFAPLLGSAAKARERIAELAAFAAATPFELPGIASASRILETLTQGALSTGAGLTLVGDVAAATNTEFSEIATTIGRLYDGLQSGRPVGEAMARLQELGVISGSTRGQLEAMQAEGAKGAAIWGVAERALGSFTGSMERQSVTWNGKLSTLRDTLSAVMAKFGEPIRDSLKPFLDGLTARIEETEALAVRVGQKIAAAFDIARAAAQSGNIAELLGAGLVLGVIDAVNAFSAGIRKTTAFLGAALAEIMASARDSWGAQEFLGILKNLGEGLAAMITSAILKAIDAIPGIDVTTDAKREANTAENKFRQAGNRLSDLDGASAVQGGLDALKRAQAAGAAAAAQAGGEPVLDRSTAAANLAAVMEPINRVVEQNRAAAAATAAALDAKLAGAKPQESASAAAAVAGKAKAAERPAADRLAQIGGFVGGAASGLQRKAAEATAKWTQRTAQGIDKLLARPLSTAATTF